MSTWRNRGASGGLTGAPSERQNSKQQPNSVSPIRLDFVSPIRPTAQFRASSGDVGWPNLALNAAGRLAK